MKKNLVLLPLALAAAASHAAERIWNGADGANWHDEAVWLVGGEPASVPENTDTVTINNGTTVNLTAPALDDTNRFNLVQLNGNARGTLIVGPSAYLPTVGLEISRNGSAPDTPGRVVVDGATVHATGGQLIGTDSVNNPGRLEIINNANYTSTAAFRLYTGHVLVSNAAFTATFTSYIHGSSATNVFEIVDGTVNMTAFAIGRDVQNASGKACRNVLRMRSGFFRSTGDLEIGHTGLSSVTITGAVEQTGGTVLSSSGNVRVPITATAVGEYLLGGGLFAIHNTGDSLFLGGRDGAARGFLRVTDGIFTNRGNTLVGSYTNGYGEISVSDGTAAFERSINVGAAPRSTGTVALSDGTLTLFSAANLNLGNASNAFGRCTVSGGLLNAPGRAVNIGSAAFGNGLLVLTGGTVTNSTINVGAASTASGTLIISNGLCAITGGLVIGQTNNTGRAEIHGGLLTVGGATSLGNQAESSGTLIITGGTVSNAGFNVGHVQSSTGAMEVHGGEIYTANEFLVGNGSGGGGNPSRGSIGSFLMTGGKIRTTHRFILGAYGTGTALISGGEIEALRQGGTDQSLCVGRDPGTSGHLIMTGGALKGTNELVIARDSNSTGTVYIAGGDLYVNAIRRANGRHALFLAGGTLHPYNRNPSFSFTAILTNDVGFGDTGTRFGLSSLDKDGAERLMHVTATFSGIGGLSKRDAGSVTLGGNLTYTGPTVVEAGTLALSNAVASLPGTLIDIFPDAILDVSVNRAAAFTVADGQLLKGEGTVKGPLRLAANATLSGGSPETPGVLTIDGNLTLDTDSTVLFNSLGTAYSRIDVTGDLTLPSAAALTVNGGATPDAEGRPVLTWQGTLNMPTRTQWNVTGEKDPYLYIKSGTKEIRLSYARGTLFFLQ